ncbi:MAG: hypothetical protein IT210_12590 [Armatimonadetes bacterium]|nr:hypothetical protein [Armatimonadota bacterium]
MRRYANRAELARESAVEEEADRWLKRSAPSKERPARPEKEMARLQRRRGTTSWSAMTASEQEGAQAIIDECRSGVSEMARLECHLIAEDVKMTPQQKRVLIGAWEGDTLRGMAAEEGVSFQAIWRILKTVRKLAAASRYIGLTEVYRREIERGRYRKPVRK